MKLLNTMKLLITVQSHKYKMESYRVQCKKYTKNITPRIVGTNNGKATIFSKCATCGSKTSKTKETIK